MGKSSPFSYDPWLRPFGHWLHQPTTMQYRPPLAPSRVARHGVFLIFRGQPALPAIEIKERWEHFFLILKSSSLRMADEWVDRTASLVAQSNSHPCPSHVPRDGKNHVKEGCSTTCLLPGSLLIVVETTRADPWPGTRSLDAPTRVSMPHPPWIIAGWICCWTLLASLIT